MRGWGRDSREHGYIILLRLPVEEGNGNWVSLDRGSVLITGWVLVLFLLFLLRKYGCKDAECITKEVLKTLEIKEDKLTVEDIWILKGMEGNGLKTCQRKNWLWTGKKVPLHCDLGKKGEYRHSKLMEL